jgi:long-chain fatty acid transport protein
MNIKLRKSLMAVAVSSLLVTPLAQATNGYFSDGNGAKSRGMGGASASLSNETGNIVSNPAAAVNMGERMDIGLGAFSPSPRSYTISGAADLCGPGCNINGTDESGRDIFLIPFYGQSFSIDDNSSWAVTVSALGGMNTDFKQNPFQSFATAFGVGNLGNLAIDLKQVAIGGTYARKVTPELALGVTVALTIQQFQARGLALFGFAGLGPLSTDPANLSDNGKSRSTGIGINLGAQYDLGNDMVLGFNYSPSIDMSEFDEYKGLFAEQGDFDIPSHYSVGLSMKPSPDMLVAVEYRRINYTDVASVSNPSSNLTDISGPLTSCMTGNAAMCLGGAQGAGFGWNDMDIIKFGVAWEQSEGMTYRAGWNHGGSPIEAEDATINIIAPGVTEDHLTLGMTMALDSSSEISADFIHAFANDVTGPAPVAFAGPAATTTIEMEQNFFEVQYGKRF